MRRSIVLFASVLVVGCGEPVPTASKPDASDSGTAAKAVDAGRMFDGGRSDSGTPDAGSSSDAGFVDAGRTPDAGSPDASVDLPDPVLFVHGINGSSEEFDVMRDRLVQDGWPADRLFAIDFADPSWGCNVDNASAIQAEVTRIKQLTGASRIDLVAHSMGTLSSRHYIKFLGGAQDVNTYVTLGGLHHGNRLSCLNPLDVCVWQELCPTKAFLMSLNADPATPGDLAWISIYSTDDGVVPVASSELDGAENIEVMGIPHAGTGGLTEAVIVYDHVRRVLDYPAW